MIMYNISNMTFQAQALYNPINEKHLYMNIAYSINSIVCIILQAVTFKDDKYLGLILLNSYLFMIRMSLRIVDIEETALHIG